MIAALRPRNPVSIHPSQNGHSGTAPSGRARNPWTRTNQRCHRPVFMVSGLAAAPRPGMTKILCTILADFDPRQLVLVVKEMAQLRARMAAKRRAVSRSVSPWNLIVQTKRRHVPAASQRSMSAKSRAG